MKEQKKEQSSQYIVNLAEQIVGKNIISGIGGVAKTEPHELFLLLLPQIQAKLHEMTPETLGRICSYGFHMGGLRAYRPFAHDRELVLCASGEFIHGTGIRDVHPDSFGSGTTGRRLLEKIAASVIAATVNDIIHQAEYQAERREERAKFHDRYPVHP